MWGEQQRRTQGGGRRSQTHPADDSTGCDQPGCGTGSQHATYEQRCPSAKVTSSPSTAVIAWWTYRQSHTTSPTRAVALVTAGPVMAPAAIPLAYVVRVVARRMATGTREASQRRPRTVAVRTPATPVMERRVRWIGWPLPVDRQAHTHVDRLARLGIGGGPVSHELAAVIRRPSPLRRNARRPGQPS